MDAAHRPQQSQQHSYTTRKAHNITIKPPANLRHPQHSATKPKLTAIDADQQPQASTSRQLHSLVPCKPHEIPEFPPPDVILHKDDVGSKVFLALARSLLSVDNRATTVKDLADLAMNNGLGCQNSSAATQAITTYLRLHNDRCEADHDQPLLLSHTMSGTDADDDLIPALYSLQGGNPRKLSPDRKTNFRKNTTVWYLSRATGAPCPFARAGIRLCDYVELGEEEPEKEHKRRRSKHIDPQLAGQKRKRPLRSCVAKGHSDSESEKDEDNRPQKKLTLRIKLNGFGGTARPSHDQSRVDSDDDSSSDESIQPMTVDLSDREEDDNDSKKEEEEEWRLPPYPRRSISIPCYTPSYEGSYPQFPLYSDYHASYRRSPSLACSVGSPPPDSEDEADDFHITMTRTDNLPDDSSSESESEGETQFESPGPRSPSAPLLPSSSITVKEEPRDLQGMLDAWDDFDSGVAEHNVVRVEAHPVKSEPLDIWDWDSEPTARIKQEDLGFDSFDALFPSHETLSTPSLSMASSSSSPSEFSTTMQDSHSRANTVRLRSKTVPVFSSQATPAPTSSSSSSVPPPPSLATRNNSISGTTVETATVNQPFSSNNLPPSIASLIESMNALCSPAISPTSLILNPIVHTCQPCTPPINATNVEYISVYQMVLGDFHFLRRVDTDFVNLTPIVAFTQSPFPVITTIPNATIIAKGSPSVQGIWVPLSAAQAYVRDHSAPNGEFDVFLSDQLPERFPAAIQEFANSNAYIRALNHFGPHFGRMQATHTVPLSPTDMLARQSHLQSLMSMSSSSEAYALSSALSISDKHQTEIVEPPLNATEQEIFELCVVPDWDREVDSGSSEPGSATTAPKPEPRGSDEDIDMQVEEQEDGYAGADDLSDTSSLSSLDSSLDESGAVPLIEEVEVNSSSNLPPPLQMTDSSSSRTTALRERERAETKAAHPPGSVSITMEEDGCTAFAPQTKRKASLSRPIRAAPLRRSKRVADIVTHQQTSTSPSTSAAATRSRRRGSRNSLS